MSFTAFDSAMMQRAIQLALLAVGKTSPNPLVGAVVVQGETVIGEGFHPGPGQPHAEIFALRAAGAAAQGATIYINLEPCNHYGRTPPCTDALIKAGVAKVVVGMIDPDPRVSGTGVAKLQSAGIEVVVGVEEQACQQLNEAFIHRVRHHLPFGILKYAMTLDGKIATAEGHSAWVSSEASRALVYQLRAAADAIVIGGNTLRRDNPYLTTHGKSDRQPLRVVLSRTLDLPLEANLWRLDDAPTLVLTSNPEQNQTYQHLQDLGIEIVKIFPLNPYEVMKYLYSTEKNSVMWECGGNLAAQAIAAGVIQKIIAFIAPKIIGGEGAPSPVGDLGLRKMTEAKSLQQVTVQEIGGDILIQGYLRPADS